MKKYLLFQGASYYPLGGAQDFKSSSDDIDELKMSYRCDHAEGLLDSSGSWAEIADRDTMQVVAHAKNGEWGDGPPPQW